MNLRRSIKIALALKGMAQKDLAAQIGSSQSSMSTLASQSSCSALTLEKLAKAFGMKVSEFIALGEE